MRCAKTMAVYAQTHSFIRAEPGSTVMGSYCNVVGDDLVVTGHCCTVRGHRNEIKGADCVVYGNYNVVRGGHATVYGHHNYVLGIRCNVYGGPNAVTGTHSRAHSGEDRSFLRTMRPKGIHVLERRMSKLTMRDVWDMLCRGSGACRPMTMRELALAADGDNDGIPKGSSEGRGDIPGPELDESKDDAHEDPSSDGCAQCLERVPAVAFAPCGHKALCRRCTKVVLQQDEPKCVICRATPTSYLIIYDV